MSHIDTAPPRAPWDAANPYPFYEQRRTGGEITWDDNAQAWLVLGYHAARQILGADGWTSDVLANPRNRDSMDPVGREFTSSSMVFADGTVHDRLRGAVKDVFTRSFITHLAAGVESVAAAVTNHPPTGAPLDFMTEIALPLPLAVIGEWLELDSHTSQVLREQSPALIRMLGALADPNEVRTGEAAAAALMARLLPLAADRRAHPGDDLVSFIVADPALDLAEVAMTAILIAVAGHETTANLLGAAVVRLLTPSPDGRRLADQVDPADPALVTELLRLDAPVQATMRTATHDHHIGGIDIATGQSALVVVAAANRDPAVFEQPDAFRTDRTGPAPLSFGYGAHYCLGAALARLEITSILPKFFRRGPLLAGPVRWRDTPVIRGPRTVPVVFTNE